MTSFRFLPFTAILALICCLSTGCDDEEDYVPDDYDPAIENPLQGQDSDYVVEVDSCDVQSGSARLLPSSYQLWPHAAGDNLVYVNESGETAEYTLTEISNSIVDFTTTTFTNNQADTINYCFQKEVVIWRLFSDTEETSFTVRLEAFPNYLTPELDPAIDLLLIFNRPNPDIFGFRRFQKGFSRSGEPFAFNDDVNQVDDSRVFNGRTFREVESSTLYGTDNSRVWYNRREGIVAFEDAAGQIWRLR